jgi:predicted transcriptional regulator
MLCTFWAHPSHTDARPTPPAGPFESYAAMTTPIRSYRAANTMSVLEQLASAPRSIPELAELVEVHVRTVRRIIGPLAAAEYVERVPDDPHRKRYRLAARARRLGHRLAATGSARPEPSA